MQNKYFVVGNEVLIKLFDSDGKVHWTIIDLEDLIKVDAFKGMWKACATNKKKNKFYAAIRVFKTGAKIYLHKIILPHVKEVDHKNRNRLDNRKYNLRSVTRSINAFNKSLQSNNISDIAGVYFKSNINKWSTQIKINGKIIYLGIFKTKDAA